jgi:hypothetical protein
MDVLAAASHVIAQSIDLGDVELFEKKIERDAKTQCDPNSPDAKRCKLFEVTYLDVIINIIEYNCKKVSIYSAVLSLKRMKYFCLRMLINQNVLFQNNNVAIYSRLPTYLDVMMLIRTVWSQLHLVKNPGMTIVG